MKYIFKTREGYQENLSNKISENHKLGKYENAHKALENRIWWTNGSNNVYIKKDEEPPKGYYRGRTKTWKNHKVSKITFLNDTADVYDIEVEDNHNFALTAGVFVHNSKDSADAVCGAVWNAAQHAEELSIDFIEDIENTLKVSNDNDSNNLEQITVDFENELKNVFSGLPTNTSEESKKIDFGFGPSVPLNSQYLSQGIMVW